MHALNADGYATGMHAGPAGCIAASRSVRLGRSPASLCGEEGVAALRQDKKMRIPHPNCFRDLAGTPRSTRLPRAEARQHQLNTLFPKSLNVPSAIRDTFRSVRFPPPPPLFIFSARATRRKRENKSRKRRRLRKVQVRERKREPFWGRFFTDLRRCTDHDAKSWRPHTPQSVPHPCAEHIFRVLLSKSKFSTILVSINVYCPFLLVR